jgi:hypothetical protein
MANVDFQSELILLPTQLVDDVSVRVKLLRSNGGKNVARMAELWRRSRYVTA